MGFAIIRDLGSHIITKGLTAQSGTAGGTGDNTELTSGAIDRAVAGGVMYLSGVINITYLTTLTASETLSATVKIAESADGTTFGSDTTLASAVVLKTGAATAAYDTYEISLDLSQYKRYVRVKVTLDCSASGTDTFLYASTLILGTPDSLPV